MSLCQKTVCVFWTIFFSHRLSRGRVDRKRSRDRHPRLSALRRVSRSEYRRCREYPGSRVSRFTVRHHRHHSRRSERRWHREHGRSRMGCECVGRRSPLTGTLFGRFAAFCEHTFPFEGNGNSPPNLVRCTSGFEDRSDCPAIINPTARGFDSLYPTI